MAGVIATSYAPFGYRKQILFSGLPTFPPDRRKLQL
jgi:hypothetical protein